MVTRGTLWALVYVLLVGSLSLPVRRFTTPLPQKAGFVAVKHGAFQVDDTAWFPVMLNYVAEFRELDDTLFLGPIRDYEVAKVFETSTLDSAQLQLAGHFQLVKQLGFNSLRICLDRVGEDSLGYFYPAKSGKLYINRGQDNRLLDALEGLLKAAHQADLRVMLLVQTPTRHPDFTRFTQRLMQRFQQDPTLFAYDLLNEPLYDDDSGAETKADAIAVTELWRRMQRRYAPHQLITAGLTEPIEVFRWDPSLLDLDFLAIHTYNPLRYPNEVYWYHKYGGLPFMMAETALPADNDSVSYTEQRHYLVESFRRLRECGGIGYGWWAFQEVPAEGAIHFEYAYTGLLGRTGSLPTPSGYVMQQTSLKPVAPDFQTLMDRVEPMAPCTCAVNYPNMMGFENYVIEGQVVDAQTQQPIEGAVIRGWNEWFSVGQNTFTDSLGRFKLYTNDRAVHFNIGAPGYALVRREKVDLAYSPTRPGVPPEADLPERMREYRDIDYHRYLATDTAGLSPTPEPTTTALFQVDTALVSRAAYRTELPRVELSRMRR